MSVSIEEIRELRDNRLGVTLTAMAAGVHSRDRINTWCAGASAPTDEQAQRLRFTFDILHEVAAAENSWDLARSWFIGANVGEEEISPCEGIRQDRFDEVRTSARRMVEDVPYSA
jgi:hypothetical protein